MSAQRDTSPDQVTLNLDMDNRDPNSLNNQLQTRFEDVIGEPDGAHSADVVWINSYKCFQTGRDCCYSCLTYVCAIPLAFCWGCYFSCITFSHIWSVTPCFRVFSTNFGCLSKFFSTVVHCCCDACYESMALIFTKIYIYVIKEGQTFKDRTYEGYREFESMDDPYDNRMNATKRLNAQQKQQHHQQQQQQQQYQHQEEKQQETYENVDKDLD